MKTLNFKFLFFFLLSTLFFVGCKKDFDGSSASKPTYLPDIALVGNDIVVIVSGVDTYEEDGAEASVNGETVDYTITGNIDNSTAGIYTLTYTATNTDGFSASVERTVIVLEEAFIPGSAELTGSYIRSANGRPSTVTKIADGVYYMSDAWGSATSGGQPLPVPAYLFCTDGENITMPTVSTVFGDMEGEGTFNGSTMSIYTVLLDQGPFARTNTWILQ